MLHWFCPCCTPCLSFYTVMLYWLCPWCLRLRRVCLCRLLCCTGCIKVVAESVVSVLCTLWESTGICLAWQLACVPSVYIVGVYRLPMMRQSVSCVCPIHCFKCTLRPSCVTLCRRCFPLYLIFVPHSLYCLYRCSTSLVQTSVIDKQDKISSMVHEAHTQLILRFETPYPFTASPTLRCRCACPPPDLCPLYSASTLMNVAPM